MTDINQKLFDMIKQNKSLDEISNTMNLSYKQIYYRMAQIEALGYPIKRQYNSNGNIKYLFKKQDKFKLYNDEKTLKTIAISDLHIGNMKSDMDAIDTIYNYCIKNNIHTILICGDLLDGTYSKEKQIINAEDQIEYLLKKYPYDKKINNFYVSGDHDASILKDLKISLDDVLIRKRHDIFPIDYYSNSNNININNNIITISHKFPTIKHLDNVKLQLMGHKHISKSFINIKNSRSPVIVVPTISRINNIRYDQTSIPRALELTFYMNDNFNFNHIEKKDLLVLNNKVINTGSLILNYSDDCEKDLIKYDSENGYSKKLK